MLESEHHKKEDFFSQNAYYFRFWIFMKVLFEILYISYLKNVSMSIKTLHSSFTVSKKK